MPDSLNCEAGEGQGKVMCSLSEQQPAVCICRWQRAIGNRRSYVCIVLQPLLCTQGVVLDLAPYLQGQAVCK